MAGPLLETKLYVPASRSGLVPRPRLSQRLQRGLGCKLMLVSAPAGFGKTTLLAEWLDSPVGSGPERATAWLSLDQNDNDPATFWTYVVAALRYGGAGDRREHPRTPAGGPGDAGPAAAHHADQRAGPGTDRRGPGARRLPRHRLARGAGRHRLPARAPAAAAASGDREQGRPGAAAGEPPGAGRAGRGAGRRPSLHHRRGGVLPQRRDGPGAHSRGRRRLWRGAPKVGSRRCSSPRSPWRGGTTRRGSSPASRATTATSSTTSWRRCSSASPSRSRTS